MHNLLAEIEKKIWIQKGQKAVDLIQKSGKMEAKKDEIELIINKKSYNFFPISMIIILNIESDSQLFFLDFYWFFFSSIYLSSNK